MGKGFSCAQDDGKEKGNLIQGYEKIETHTFGSLRKEKETAHPSDCFYV